MKRTVKGNVTLPSEFFMGDSYRDAIRKQSKKAQNSSVSRAIAWSATKARAALRSQHARESFHRRRKGLEALEAPVQEKMI